MNKNITFDVNNIDVTNIMSQIKNKIDSTDCTVIFNAEGETPLELTELLYQRISERNYDEDALAALKNFTAGAYYSSSAGGSFDSLMKNISKNAEVRYFWKLERGNTLVQKFRILRYKITRKFMYFYFKYVFDQQNKFNMAAFAAICELSEKYSALEKENVELKQRLDGIEASFNVFIKKEEKYER